MEVANFFEKVNLLLFGKQCRANAVDWRVAPSLVKETATLVQVVEISAVGFRAPQRERGNLKV